MSNSASNFTPTEKTQVRRKPDRGSYDRELIYRILDEAFVCQVAFIANGLPFVVPTNMSRRAGRNNSRARHGGKSRCMRGASAW